MQTPPTPTANVAGLSMQEWSLLFGMVFTAVNCGLLLLQIRLKKEWQAVPQQMQKLEKDLEMVPKQMQKLQKDLDKIDLEIEALRADNAKRTSRTSGADLTPIILDLEKSKLFRMLRTSGVPSKLDTLLGGLNSDDLQGLETELATFKEVIHDRRLQIHDDDEL